MAPEEIHGVSMSQFSIARHYGGIQYQGHYYAYDPVRDVLTRADVLKARAKAAKKVAKARPKADAEQSGLF